MRSRGSYITLAARRLSVILVLTFTGQATLTIGVTTPTVAAGITRCRDSQLAVTVAQLGGAAVTGGFVVRYRNLSPYACTLSGYPTVIGVVSPTGPAQAATDVVSGVLGGWQTYAARAQEPLPTVVLSAKGGMASSVVEFVSTGSAQSLCFTKRYPLWFHSVWLNLPGGTRPFALSVPAVIVCSYFDTNPIVPGTTGSAAQAPH